MNQESYNPLGYSEEQLWCLGLSAVNAEGNGERHDVLVHNDQERYRNVLSAWWDIVDRNTYHASIEWLRSGGHRTDFNDILGVTMSVTGAEWNAVLARLEKLNKRAWYQHQLVYHYRTVVRGQGIVAWDLARVVLLARMAATCGFIAEAEAWNTIYNEAEHANKLFNNWYEFAHSYLIGRQFAMRNLNDASGKENIRSTHTLFSDPSSPWLRYPVFGACEFSHLVNPTSH